MCLRDAAVVVPCSHCNIGFREEAETHLVACQLVPVWGYAQDKSAFASFRSCRARG